VTATVPHPPAPAGTGGAALHLGGQTLGPFKPVVWLGIIGGGITLGLLVRSRSRSAGVEPAAATDDTAGVTYPGSGVVSLPTGAGSTVTTTAAPATNNAWLNAATVRLVAEGQDPVLVQSALRKYLDGKPMTPQETAIVSLAIRYLGPPPDGAPPAETTTAPTTPTPVAPVDLSRLSNTDLVRQGNALIRSYKTSEAATYAAEAFRRITVARTLSVNDPLWTQQAGDPDPGSPAPLKLYVWPLVLQYMADHGLRFP
jgi:hypothetical protein